MPLLDSKREQQFWREQRRKARFVVVAAAPRPQALRASVRAGPRRRGRAHDDEEIVATAPAWTTVTEVRRGAKALLDWQRLWTYPAGVKPGTISNLAVSSPMRDPSTGEKATVTAVCASGSPMDR